MSWLSVLGDKVGSGISNFFDPKPKSNFSLPNSSGPGQPGLPGLPGGGLSDPFPAGTGIGPGTDGIGLPDPKTDPSVWGRIGKVLGWGIDQAKKVFQNPDGSINWGALAKAGVTAAAVIGTQQDNAAQQDYLNKRLGMQQDILDSAKADYASRAPLRDQSFAKLAQLSANGPSGDIYRPHLRAQGIGGTTESTYKPPVAAKTPAASPKPPAPGDVNNCAAAPTPAGRKACEDFAASSGTMTKLGGVI